MIDPAVDAPSTFIEEISMPVTTPRFLFIYRHGSAKREDPSREHKQQAMQWWMDWIDGGLAAGWMLEGGDAFMPSGLIVNRDLSLMKCPTGEANECIGYSIIEAADLTAAVQLARGSPRLRLGGTVEVRELVGLRKPHS